MSEMQTKVLGFKYIYCITINHLWISHRLGLLKTKSIKSEMVVRNSGFHPACSFSRPIHSRHVQFF